MTDHPTKHKSTDAAHKVAKIAHDLEVGADNDLDLMVAGLLFRVSAVIKGGDLDRFQRLYRFAHDLVAEALREQELPAEDAS